MYVLFELNKVNKKDSERVHFEIKEFNSRMDIEEEIRVYAERLVQLLKKEFPKAEMNFKVPRNIDEWYESGMGTIYYVYVLSLGNSYSLRVTVPIY